MSTKPGQLQCVVLSVWWGLLVLALVAVGCGDGDDVGQPATPTAADGHVVEKDATYLGTEYYAEPGNAYPELGEFRSTGLFTGTVGGRLVLYADPSGRDLVALVSYPDNVLVDAIRLSGNTSNAALRLSCEGEAAVLIVGPAPPRYFALAEADRAWRGNADGQLEEFDPATGETVGVDC